MGKNFAKIPPGWQAHIQRGAGNLRGGSSAKFAKFGEFRENRVWYQVVHIQCMYVCVYTYIYIYICIFAASQLPSFKLFSSRRISRMQF